MKRYPAGFQNQPDKISAIKRLRAVSLITGFLFLISLTIVFVAGIKSTAGFAMKYSDIIGPVDGVIAFAIVGLSIYVQVLITKVNTQNAFVISYKFMINCFQVAALFTGLLFFILWYKREEFDFNILLPGLAWRSFILISYLPMLFLNKTR